MTTTPPTRTPILTVVLLLGMAALLAGAPPALAAGGPSGAAAVPPGGLLLGDLAGRCGLGTTVDPVSGRVVLSGGDDRIVIIPGAHQALVNGEFVYLGARASVEGGDIRIERAAAEAILARLGKARGGPSPAALAPRPVPAARAAATGAGTAPRPAAARGVPNGITVALDPGHGGNHTGARGRTGLLEKDINLDVARHARTLLEARGYEVRLTRQDDRHLSPNVTEDLDLRVRGAAQAGADILVSIHTNYAASTEAAGFEVYYAAGRFTSLRLARAIARALGARIPDEDRGVKTAGFRVIKRPTVPAVLVEVGFVSHPPTERRLATADYRQKLAEAIVAGIDAYFRNAAGRPSAGR